MSKETMLYKLQTAKSLKSKDSKEWIDINEMIIDVTRMKQDDVQTENNTIHHYLPVHYPTGCQDVYIAGVIPVSIRKHIKKGSRNGSPLYLQECIKTVIISFLVLFTKKINYSYEEVHIAIMFFCQFTLPMYCSYR